MLAEGQLPRNQLIQLIKGKQERKQQIESELSRFGNRILDMLSAMDIELFRKELNAALDDEDTKKVTCHGPIKDITVPPNATL